MKNNKSILDHINDIQADVSIGGYSVHNLTDNAFFSSNERKVSVSFKLYDLLVVDDIEMMKLLLFNGYVCRVIKFVDADTTQPSIMFDVVDELNKEIKFKSDKIFHFSAGFGAFLFDHRFISQWDVAPADKLSRAFLLGDKGSFKDILHEFNIKVYKPAQLYIEYEME